MIGETSPVSRADQEAQLLAEYERRIAELERRAGRRGLGFSARRTTNDSAISASTTANITFNHIDDDSGFNLGAFTTGSSITVPAGGGGVYVISAGIYYGAPVSSLYPSVSLNGTNAVAAPSAPSSTRDRDNFTGVVRLAAGDLLRLRVENASGGPVTPTATSVAAQTLGTPFISAWRISN